MFDALFWERLHGGSTHFPIVLLLVSVVLDVIALRSQDEGLQRGLRATALGMVVLGVLGGCGAVISGLVMSDGRMLGSGLERMHHLFVWPAFTLAVGLSTWRLIRGGQLSARAFRVYLGGMGLASLLMMGAGYWGGEMLLGPPADSPATSPAAMGNEKLTVEQGHHLFLMNCAHCHGTDARGTDDGPDLTTFKKSDSRIATVITNGIKGEMPRFQQKLHADDIRQLIQFLHSVRGMPVSQQNRLPLRNALVPTSA